jgi:hypothetical protein
MGIKWTVILVQYLRLNDEVLMPPPLLDLDIADDKSKAFARVISLEQRGNAIQVGFDELGTALYPIGFTIGVAIREPLADPLVPVRSATLPERTLEWHISQDLSDRWGELNLTGRFEKPLEALETDSRLLERLRKQMYAEMTFIVRKESMYGVLFEMEFDSVESDGPDTLELDGPEAAARLLPYESVIGYLRNALTPLVSQFPEATFALPPPSEVFNGRPAVWVFIPDGVVIARQMLGHMLTKLGDSFPDNPYWIEASDSTS